MTSSNIRHALRAALAATLAMACVKALGLSSGFWAPLSALAVLQAQIGASLAASRNYLIASAIGVVLGASIVSVVGDNVLFAGAGIFPIVLFSLAMKLPPAGASIAAGVVPVLVLAVTGSPWRYGAYRLIDIAIGLASAILVSLLLWPSRAVTQFRQGVSGAIRDAGLLASSSLRVLTVSGPTPDPGLEARVRNSLEAAQGLLPAARQEPQHAAAHDLLPFYLAHAQRIAEHARMVDELASSGIPDVAVRAMGSQAQQVASAIDAAADALAQAVESGIVGKPLEGAEKAVRSLQGSIAGLHAVDLSALAQDDGLLRVHSLTIALDSLGQEIERALRHIEHPDQLIVGDPSTPAVVPAPHRHRLPFRWWRRTRTGQT